MVVLACMVAPAIAAHGQATHEPQELSRDAALELFYKNNYDILITKYEIDKSYADYVGSKLLPNPTFLASRTGMDLSNRLADAENTQSTLRIEQLIETGGKRSLRMNVASENLEATKLTHQDTIRLLIVGFYSLYYGLHQDLLNYELASQEVARFRRILDIAEKRYSAGFLSLIDYTKLKLSVIELENNLANFSNQLANDSTYFGYIIGAGNPVRPPGTMEPDRVQTL